MGPESKPQMHHGLFGPCVSQETLRQLCFAASLRIAVHDGVANSLVDDPAATTIPERPVTTAMDSEVSMLTIPSYVLPA